MAKGNTGTNKSLTAIQKLLAEKVQIERWLERLSLAGDKTPESVRQKVSGDYRKKLEEVTRELGNFGEELQTALKRGKANRDSLRRQEETVQEQLSEAEVRHAVGEFDENKWRQVNAEFLQSLVRVREELKNAEEEIAKLEEVVQGMSDAEKAAESAPDTEPPTSSPKPPALGKTAVMQAVKPIKDELAFLKSVTEDDKQGPSAGRASGSMKSMEPTPPPPSPPPPPPPPSKKPLGDIGASGIAAIDQGGQSKKLAGNTTTVEKSLKCKECGTMNLPTEWYCESCGAELSAI